MWERPDYMDMFMIFQLIMINVDDILDIYKYLMKQHNIK